MRRREFIMLFGGAAVAGSVTGFGLPARSLSSQHSPTAPGRRPKAFRERTRGMRAPGAAGAMGISEAWWVRRRYGDGGGNVADERARIDRRWESRCPTLKQERLAAYLGGEIIAQAEHHHCR